MSSNFPEGNAVHVGPIRSLMPIRHLPSIANIDDCDDASSSGPSTPNNSVRSRNVFHYDDWRERNILQSPSTIGIDVEHHVTPNNQCTILAESCDWCMENPWGRDDDDQVDVSSILDATSIGDQNRLSSQKAIFPKVVPVTSMKKEPFGKRSINGIH
jgi:hypothetical protein